MWKTRNSSGRDMSRDMSGGSKFLRRLMYGGTSVLVAGGLLGSVTGAAFAATLNSWAAAGTLGTARSGETATLL